MDRRQYLSTVLAGGGSWLSGCAGLGEPHGSGGTPNGDVNGTATRRGAGTPSEGATALARLGYPSDICEAKIVEGFSIRAIVDPAFDSDWTGLDVDPKYARSGAAAGSDDEAVSDRADGLDDEAVVIGRTHDGEARAYPLSVVWWHEIVNDTFGVPLLVTYCPICNSGLVAERQVEAEPTLFRVSGQLWRPPDNFAQVSVEDDRAFGADRWNVSERPGVKNAGNLVMYDDATRSYWSQVLGRAICGPMADAELAVVPFSLSSWGAWRTRHPGTDVLLPPPHSGLDDR